MIKKTGKAIRNPTRNKLPIAVVHADIPRDDTANLNNPVTSGAKMIRITNNETISIKKAPIRFSPRCFVFGVDVRPWY